MKLTITILWTVLTIVYAWGQNDFQWTKDLDLPYTDINGNPLTGTEVIHLVSHKGKLYAGNSYWNENTVPRRGQVWVKETYNGTWKRDYQMPVTHSRVPSLYSFVFQRDHSGTAITPDTILFAGATYDKGANVNGPAVIFMRDDATNSWVLHNLGYTSHAFSYTQIRSMGFHRDKVTGVDLVFAGANPAPTGVYTGTYNPASPGKIQWSGTPEFMPSGYQRIMGFAVCNDTLYMATQREVYKRLDGTSPAWVQVLNMADTAIVNQYGAGLDPYWLNDEDIRCFRTIKNPDGQHVLIFGGFNHIFRLEPHNNYQLIAEQDIEDVLELSTGHNFQYLQTQIIKDFVNPNTNDTVHLIGFEAMYDTTYLANNPQPNLGWFNKQGWYFERKQTGSVITYTHKEIADPGITPQPDSLARVRTFEVSPFPQDSGKVIYSGGFAPWFIGGVTNTAWIYKGSLTPNPITGNTVYNDINYTTGSPQNELNLDVYVPDGGLPSKPVVIYVHGGSWRTGDKSNTGYKDEFFTGMGYIFVSVNYRLSPDPIDLNDTARILFPDHPEDLAKAIKWVFDSIASYGGDTSKVTIIGHSAGAHLISLVTTDETYLNNEGLLLSKLKCACSLDAGAYDIPYYLNTYQTPGDGQWNNYVNAFGSDTSVWANASPINHLAPNKGIPEFMLVHQGTAQRIDLATRFGNALSNNSVPVSMLNADPLDHEGINQVIGSTNPLVQIYNDSLAHFFSNCLNNTVSAVNKPVFKNNTVVIFPNPAGDIVTISGLANDFEGTVSVYNAMGERMHFEQKTGTPFSIETGNLSIGIYFIQIKAENGILITRKFIKH